MLVLLDPPEEEDLVELEELVDGLVDELEVVVVVGLLDFVLDELLVLDELDVLDVLDPLDVDDVLEPLDDLPESDEVVVVGLLVVELEVVVVVGLL